MPAREIAYVVDAHAPARDALCLFLRVNGLDARGFASAQDLLAGVEPDAAGCVVTAHLPELRGADLIRVLREAGVSLPVIVVTDDADVAAAVRALKAGAADLIEKPYEPDVMLRSVFQALEASHADRSARAQAVRAMRRLTARERQVLQLVVHGADDAAIAPTLGLSARTVETLRMGILHKLDVRSLADLLKLTMAGG